LRSLWFILTLIMCLLWFIMILIMLSLII